jgi:hypothetical protein
VSLIDGKLLMNFHQLIRFIIDFLPEANGILLPVHLLEITRPPAMMPGYIEPVAPPAAGSVSPLTKLPLVLFPGRRGNRLLTAPTACYSLSLSNLFFSSGSKRGEQYPSAIGRQTSRLDSRSTRAPRLSGETQ